MRTILLSLALCASALGQAVSISPATFSGSGLNDATVGGRWTTAPLNASFVVTISATGTPDHFTWAKNGGSASSPIAITGTAQTLSDGVTITFAATTGHTTLDAWTITATASGSVSASTFMQRGVGARFRTAEEKLRESLSVTDFGADKTGVADSSNAFDAAQTALGPDRGQAGRPGIIRVPFGAYALSRQFILHLSNTKLVCDPGTTITYTGAADVGSTILLGIDAGTYAPTPVGFQGIDGCTISGSAHTTKAALHLSNTSSTEVRNVDLKNAPSCLLTEYSNSQKLYNVICGQYSGLMTILPAKGIQVHSMNNVEIFSPSVEDLCSNAYTGINSCFWARWAAGVATVQTSAPHGMTTGDLATIAVTDPSADWSAASVTVAAVDSYHFSYPLAVQPNQAYSEVLAGGIVTRLSDSATFAIGTPVTFPVGIAVEGSGPVSIYGGTSEGNGVAVTGDDTSSNLSLHNMDNEANPLGGLVYSGRLLHMTGGIWDSIRVSRPGGGYNGPAGTIDGVSATYIQLNTGVAGMALINNELNGGQDGTSNDPATLIRDSATCTKNENNHTVNGGGLLPEYQCGRNFTSLTNATEFVSPLIEGQDTIADNPITSASWSGGITTFVTARAHRFQDKNSVIVQSIVPSGLNANPCVVTVVDAVTFSCPGSLTNPGSYVSGGHVFVYLVNQVAIKPLVNPQVSVSDGTQIVKMQISPSAGGYLGTETCDPTALITDNTPWLRIDCVGNITALGPVAVPSLAVSAGGHTLTPDPGTNPGYRVSDGATVGKLQINTGTGVYVGSETADPACLITNNLCRVSADSAGNISIPGTLTVAGSPIANAIAQLTGDVTATGPGIVPATLASVGSAGTVGDSTHTPQITFDAKGRETSASSIAIAPVTITAGTGLSGGGAVSPGGSITLNSTAATYTAGSGISISGGTIANTAPFPGCTLTPTTGTACTNAGCTTTTTVVTAVTLSCP